ncbi:MAG TPA: putative Ig domain-containing protein, partial [Candidatus Acidoferrales bacterium]|nr:putative Ig domain-containing protein [Candidatus Acidoferrales bacterium]
MQASYTATLSASGGSQPYAWSIASGNLPAGLSLTASSGKISGTPTQSGSFGFTAKVADSSSPLQTATQALTINVSTTTPTNTLIITTNSLPGAQISVAYSATLTAINGQAPYTWSIATGSGTLPPGLSLAASTGTISGTPTASSAYIFTAQVTDSSSTPQTATHTFTMTTIGRTLDQYGGREDIKCATVTPYFHLEKINSHWFFCDPLGNGFISMSVAVTTPNTNPTLDCNGVNTYPIYAAKYGTVGDATGTGSNWGWQTEKRLTTWGFNTLGEDSGSGATLPWATCIGCNWPGGVQPIPMPIIFELKPAMNGSVNRNSFLTSPIKDIIDGTNSNYTSIRAAMFDVFDPNLSTEWQSELANPTGAVTQQILSSNPYILGVLTEDSDFFWGSGTGPDFNTGGHTNANIAWVTLITTPVRTYINSTQFQSENLLYPAQQAYSKAQAANPTTTCSISSPCSLRDYLWQKYAGSITALNTAWGSNYTTFDSTGTQVTGETIGTGNGSTLTFTHTLAHSPVSPFTVLVSVGGTPQIGDCPWFDASSSCPAVTANTGTLGSPTANYINQTTSTINYSTGAVSITFLTPPASGAPITV